MNKQEIENSSVGLRFNTGKPRWGLVHYKSMEPLVRVLEAGARKYSLEYPLELKYFNTLCQRKEFAINAITGKELSQNSFAKLVTNTQDVQSQRVCDVKKTDLLSQKICALLAMKLIGLKYVPIKLSDVSNIIQNINSDQTIKKESESEILKGRLSSVIKSKESAQSFLEDYLNMESVKVFTQSSLSEVANYVEAKKEFTLTIAIQQENSEVFFVVNAIKDWDCFKIALKLLQRLSLISETVEVKHNKILLPGDNNWMKGLVPREILECMQRHLAAIMDGETHDQETGEPHIGHIMCNAMFYSYFTETEEGKPKAR